MHVKHFFTLLMLPLLENGPVGHKMPVMSHHSPCLWTQLPQSSRSPCDRYKHACCSYDGSVYIMGGRGSSCLRDFWRYSVGKVFIHSVCVMNNVWRMHMPVWCDQSCVAEMQSNKQLCPMCQCVTSGQSCNAAEKPHQRIWRNILWWLTRYKSI